MILHTLTVLCLHSVPNLPEISHDLVALHSSADATNLTLLMMQTSLMYLINTRESYHCFMPFHCETSCYSSQTPEKSIPMPDRNSGPGFKS